MTAQKHTPGPWEVVNGTDVYLAGDTFARHFIADCDPDNAPLVNDGDHPDTDATYEEAKANARLIAAAPEMLEALKIISGMDIHHEALRAVDAVIAKATGP